MHRITALPRREPPSRRAGERQGRCGAQAHRLQIERRVELRQAASRQPFAWRWGARAGSINGVACCTTAQRAVRNCAGGRGVGVAGGRTGCALSDASRGVEPRCNGASPGPPEQESGHVRGGFCMAQPCDARHEARRAGEPQGACGGRAHRLQVERHIRLRQVVSRWAVARRLLREGAAGFIIGLRSGRGSRSVRRGGAAYLFRHGRRLGDDEPCERHPRSRMSRAIPKFGARVLAKRAHLRCPGRPWRNSSVTVLTESF